MYDLASRSREVGESLTPDYVPKNQSMDITKLKIKLERKNKKTTTGYF